MAYVNITLQNKVTRDSCKKDKACFSTPASCDPSTSNGCFFASTKGINGNSDNLTFELSGESNGYIAVGLSGDNKEVCRRSNLFLKYVHIHLNLKFPLLECDFKAPRYLGSLIYFPLLLIG